MLETKVCIIGAGPAGATTALQLAYMGIPCLVVDKAVFPRDKVCGDGLSGKVLTLLSRIDKGIAERLQQYVFKEDSWGVTFVAVNRMGINIPYKPGYAKLPDEPRGFVCKRIHFDNFPVEELKRCPQVQLIEGKAITKYELLPDGYLLRCRRQHTDQDPAGDRRQRRALRLYKGGGQHPYGAGALRGRHQGVLERYQRPAPRQPDRGYL